MAEQLERKRTMTQRSMLMGRASQVIIRAGGDVTVEGAETDRVQATSEGRRGVRIEQRRPPEVARVRARVGDRTLFDVQVDVPNPLKKDAPSDPIEVRLGGSGKVLVPRRSHVKVYAGREIEVHDIQGRVEVYAGSAVRVRNVQTLVHAAAGGALDMECDRVEGDDVKFVAGHDLRCYVKSLTDARIMVNDLGGYWEAILGSGSTAKKSNRLILRLKAGGDVTIVTDQEIRGKSARVAPGLIERPGAEAEPPSP